MRPSIASGRALTPVEPPAAPAVRPTLADAPLPASESESPFWQNPKTRQNPKSSGAPGMADAPLPASESESPCVARSPIDALIDLKVRCRLRRQIPIGLHVHPLIRLRVAVIPQRGPACRRQVRGLRVHPAGWGKT